LSQRSRFEYGLLGVLGVAVIGSTVAISGRPGDYSFFDPIIDVKRLVSERFVDVPDEQKLQNGAIQGMIETLGDQYTVYVPPSDKADFDKMLTGQYVGIGAQVGPGDGALVIITPLEDSPAYRAGLMAQDRILEIEGTATGGLSVEDCVRKLQGDPGTPVKILVERNGERTPYTIIRERIKTRSVKGFHRSDADPNTWEYMIDPVRSIAYVRLTQFTPGCAREFAAALESVGASQGKLKGLVIDLRSNPGGVLAEAEEIADLFLEEGVIVSTKGRAHKEEVTRAVKPGTLPNFPIVVLGNEGSASASEVLAGALTENNRAIMVGTRTFGKGSVQSVIPLPSPKGAELKMTEQGYYLPSGRSITRKDDSPQWGVDPTAGFYVSMTDDQTIAMLTVRREQEIIHGAADASGKGGAPRGDWSNPDWIIDTLKDPQLAAGVRAVRGYIEKKTWEPTGDAQAAKDQGSVEELRRLRLVQERISREQTRIARRVLALQGSTDAKDAGKDRDFWADDLDLTGGKIQVLDKDGKPVTTLDITGRNLERWLLDADVTKAPEAADATNAEAPKAAEAPASTPAPAPGGAK
jgi:carboxyl-terminal processing protease